MSTGKTRTLTELIREEVEQRGSGEVMAVSFSVTAAQVLAGRNSVLPKTQIGTLHSMAYRAIGSTPVALDPAVLADWNSSERPEWRVHADGRRQGLPTEREDDDPDEQEVSTFSSATRAMADAATGDELIAALDYLRATLTPEQDWPPNVAAFAARWGAWKQSVGGAVDFADMISIAHERARDGERAPGSPSVLISDESQDMTPAEVALALAWGQHADRLVLGMDDDQAIGAWRGADPSALLGLGATDTAPGDVFHVDPAGLRDRVLGRSFRVPAAAHAVAEHWIRKLSIRRDKTYVPRAADPERFGADDDGIGTAQVIGESRTDPALIDRVEAHLEAGHSVAVLTSCNFHLAPVISELRRRGIPFHNPLRPGEPRWNPLGPTTGVSTPQRIARYLAMSSELGDRARPWTGDDVAAWMELVDAKAAGLAVGAKTQAKRLGPGVLEPEQVAALFRGGADSEAFAAAVEPSLDWLVSAMLPSKAKRAPMRYAVSLARAHGPAALSGSPRCVIGTYHSFKGGEVDHAIISPDLSRSAYVQSGRTDGRDAIIRLMYVALTRGSRGVEVMQPASPTFLRPRDLLPAELEVLG